MKLNRNFVIPLSIAGAVCIFGVIVQKWPLSFVIGIMVFIVVPILIIQQKTNNDWGKVFIFGILTAIAFIVILLAVLYLANQYEWLKRILLWPS